MEPSGKQLLQTTPTPVSLQPSVWRWAWGCWWGAGLEVRKNKLDAAWRLRTRGLLRNCSLLYGNNLGVLAAALLLLSEYLLVLYSFG